MASQIDFFSSCAGREAPYSGEVDTIFFGVSDEDSSAVRFTASPELIIGLVEGVFTGTRIASLSDFTGISA